MTTTLELDPATSETTSIPDLEATSFIRKDQQSYACMAGRRDLSLATACMVLDGFWRESPLGSLNQTLSQERNLDYRMARREKRLQR